MAVAPASDGATDLAASVQALLRTMAVTPISLRPRFSVSSGSPGSAEVMRVSSTEVLGGAASPHVASGGRAGGSPSSETAAPVTSPGVQAGVASGVATVVVASSPGASPPAVSTGSGRGAPEQVALAEPPRLVGTQASSISSTSALEISPRPGVDSKGGSSSASPPCRVPPVMPAAMAAPMLRRSARHAVEIGRAHV